ncbi:MAG: TetR/AcrR family transcriptional regulator [Deltaproteobacteria bacterium]|nr:TetR/AcrR family transcriptional regulator [Deltaproteobacteria bacterium]
MPPKTTFDKDQVIQAAFAIVLEQGVVELSARKVAERLGSSPAPVYSCFKSMQELEQAVVGKVTGLLYEYTGKEYTGFEPLDLSVGMVLFARDYSKLYRTLFLPGSFFKDVVIDFHTKRTQEIFVNMDFWGISKDESDRLVRKLWVFTHGFADVISIGLIEDTSDEYIIDFMRDGGRTLVSGSIGEQDRRNPQ